MQQDHFGLQASSIPYTPANFHLQSVKMISEVQNKNSPIYSRYYPSREASHSSTPLNHSPYPFLSNDASNSNDPRSFHQEFAHLNLVDATKPVTHVDPNPLRSRPSDPAAQNLTLPQYFLVKYLGRTPCSQIWGTKAVRAPIDDLVHTARQLPSISELPTLEICVNLNGLTLTHRQSSSPHRNHHRSRSPERPHHGLIPIEYISYAMHDVKYSKIASCIVLRQSKSKNQTFETVTECYVFLFQSKDHALRFTYALAKAFTSEKQTNRITKTNHGEKREGRSKHRHEKSRHDHPNHFRDSHV